MKLKETRLELPPMDAAGTLFSKQKRRTDLPHLGQIIDHLGKELGESYPAEAEGGFSRADLNEYAEEGFVWETILTAAWRNRLWLRAGTGELGDLEAQEPIVKDGIIMTPDGVDLLDWVLIEAKATTRSRGKWEQRERYFWRWLVQIKGYCYGLSTQRCDLYVRWTCGNWNPPTPEAWLYELEFSQSELEENWQTVLGVRDRMIKAEGKKGDGKGNGQRKRRR